MAKGKRRAVVLDFDGTILRKPNQSVFHLIHLYANLSATTAAQMARIKERYLTRGDRGEITPAEERAWLLAEVAAWIEGQLTPQQVAGAMLRAQVRPHVGECLTWLRSRHIPVAIVSYGIQPFIRMVLHAHGLADLVNEVYALDLKLNHRRGHYWGYDADSVVTPASKGTWSRHFAKRYGVPIDQIYAIGDSVGDRRLGHLAANRIALAIDADEAARLQPHFGQVLVTDTFKPAWRWLQHRLR
jgi:HAD superfamily phosphoserine phosphatase-like hydrolase